MSRSRGAAAEAAHDIIGSLAVPGLPNWLDIPEPKGYRPKQQYRTIWISDIHLGTAGCNAAMLLDFLRSVECEQLYLVGDIVDAGGCARAGTGQMPTMRFCAASSRWRIAAPR